MAERAESLVRELTMLRWLVGAALAAVTAGAGIGGADAQISQPSAMTLPLVGGALEPDTAPSGVLAAVEASDSVGVHALLAANASPNEIDDYGRTALIYAVMFNNVAIAQMLVGSGANIEIHDKLGKTALHWAVERGNRDMIRLLLDAKAPVDAQNLQGVTPLMVAAGNGSADTVRLLLQFHADPRKNDYTGRDAVDWAAGHAAIAAALKVAAAH
jgi:uncharacterized protein